MTHPHLRLVRGDAPASCATPVAPALDGFNVGRIARYIRDSAEVRAALGHRTVELDIGTARLAADLIDLGTPAA